MVSESQSLIFAARYSYVYDLANCRRWDHTRCKWDPGMRPAAPFLPQSAISSISTVPSGIFCTGLVTFCLLTLFATERNRVHLNPRWRFSTLSISFLCFMTPYGFEARVAAFYMYRFFRMTHCYMMFLACGYTWICCISCVGSLALKSCSCPLRNWS